MQETRFEPNTALWAFRTIQPSSLCVMFCVEAASAGYKAETPYAPRGDRPPTGHDDGNSKETPIFTWFYFIPVFTVMFAF